MKEPFSIRKWVGPALGIALGFLFGYFLAAHGTTVVFLLFGLFVVPIVIWLSPKRPMLGWQLAIVTFAMFFPVSLNDPGERFDLAGKWFDLARSLLMTVLVWAGLFVLSSPWGVLLFRRAQQDRAVGEKRVENIKHYALVVGLIIVGSILLLVGWAMVFAPNSSPWDPPGGLLVGTLAVAVWKVCDRIASALGRVRQYARHLMQLVLLVCPLIALGGGHAGSGQFERLSSVIFGSVLGIESFAVLTWLFLTRSTGRAALPVD
jgi:hypothetical protein